LLLKRRIILPMPKRSGYLPMSEKFDLLEGAKEKSQAKRNELKQILGSLADVYKKGVKHYVQSGK